MQQPTITHFDEADGETDHVYVGRDLSFAFGDGPSVLARIHDNDPDVAILVNVSHRQASESNVALVVSWPKLRGHRP